MNSVIYYEVISLWLTFYFAMFSFTFARSNVYHYRAKLARLLCHCFVNPEFPRKTNFAYRVFSHDVTAAILVSQNNETAAMLVS